MACTPWIPAQPPATHGLCTAHGSVVILTAERVGRRVGRPQHAACNALSPQGGDKIDSTEYSIFPMQRDGIHVQLGFKLVSSAGNITFSQPTDCAPSSQLDSLGHSQACSHAWSPTQTTNPAVPPAPPSAEGQRLHNTSRPNA